MKNFILIIAATATLAGCAGSPPKPQKTSLEIQAIQAKSFEADKATTFRSVVSVLQDLGFVISTAHIETGIVTAESPTEKDTSGSAVFAEVFGKVRTQGKTAVTASVEEFGAKSTRVRLNFVSKKFRSSAYGQQASDEVAIQDPLPYQNAFEKIGEAIFIRQSQK
jgi:hypothetical protein